MDILCLGKAGLCNIKRVLALSLDSIKNEQEMPFRQQKSAEKGSERYLMFEPNHILIALRWDDGWSRKCLSVVLK